MHMADALISPAVGVAMWTVSFGLLAHSSRRLSHEKQAEIVPMMGVLGAFVFASQMINFAIPATGSSGHLGGGLLLAILLGPDAAFVVIASVLTVQALFFADGGLLALGCNIFNLGFFPAFFAYPLIYCPLAGGKKFARRRIWIASLVAAAAGLQLGAFCVVLQTSISGASDLPFGAFLLLMQPIHLLIGIVEGLVTALVVSFVAGVRPVIHADSGRSAASRRPAMRPAAVVCAALITGALLSWFASSSPDGLEWAVEKAKRGGELNRADDRLHAGLARLQERTALFPDYGFRPASEEREASAHESWPAVSAGTSVSGVIGGLLTLVLASVCGFLFRPRRSSL